jgi:hypothetical protein
MGRNYVALANSKLASSQKYGMFTDVPKFTAKEKDAAKKFTNRKDTGAQALGRFGKQVAHDMGIAKTTHVTFEDYKMLGAVVKGTYNLINEITGGTAAFDYDSGTVVEEAQEAYLANPDMTVQDLTDSLRGMVTQHIERQAGHKVRQETASEVQKRIKEAAKKANYNDSRSTSDIDWRELFDV